MSDDNMSTGEKLFWGLVVFLILKGLLDAKDANDRAKIEEAARRHRESLGAGSAGRRELPSPTLPFGPSGQVW